MKVYLVYEDAGRSCECCNERDVVAVFDSERKALDYVIRQLYSGSFYAETQQNLLEARARSHIQEMMVQ